jgi:hypothetical protein
MDQPGPYHHDINPTTLNLAFRVMHDEEFKASIREEVAKVAIQEAMAVNPEQKRKARTEFNKAVWAKCGKNAALLMPWFFPRYPRRDPFDLRNRPFNMILMFMFVYATVVLRGSRQIGKSTTMATDARLCSELFANLKQLYVAPHSEPLTTFSRKYLEVEKAFRHPVVGSKWKQNQYYKQYPNGSEFDMQRVMTSATSVRGKTADILRMDETIDRDSDILVLEGRELVKKKIFDMQVGMITLDFDENDIPRYDNVTAVICKGYRHEWRLQTATGKSLRSTGCTRIKTNRGWYAMCEFIPWGEANRCEKTFFAKTTLAETASLDPGYTTWRRQHGFFAAAERVLERALQGQPQLQASGILHYERGAAGRLCEHASEAGRQPGIRGEELCILDADNAGAGRILAPLLHPAPGTSGLLEEDGDAGVGESTDLGVGGVVVYGRRRPAALQPGLQHALVLSGGSGDAAGLVSPERDRSASKSDPSEARGLLLDAQHHGIGSATSPPEDAPLCDGEHALQVGGPDREVGLRILRREVPYGQLPPGSAADRDPGAPVLWRTVLSPATETPAPGGVCDKYRRERGRIRESEGAPGERSGKKEASAADRDGATTGAIPGSLLSGEAQRVEKGASGEDEGRGATGEAGHEADVSVLRGALSQHRESQGLPRLPDHLLHRARLLGKKGRAVYGDPPSTSEGEAEEPLRVLTIDGWEEIVDVSYHGFEEVWDIETEKHHTFFADGIGVHNCQLFDPGLEMEVLEVLNDSKMKCYQMAGTATTLESLLETRYQEGCQAVWHIRHPNGQKIINCGDPEDVIPYIGPYQMEDPITKEKIDPLNGSYEFMNPQGFENRIVSIHVPQIINPDKLKPLEWNGIYKSFVRDRRKAITEKLGVPLEEGNREVTKNDMKRICVLPEGPEERLLKCQKGYYKCLVSAFDWGGSDYNTDMKTKISTTCHVIMGLSPEHKVHILYGKRHGGADYPRILNEIALAHNKHRAGAMASDFGGGALYNTKLREHPYINARRHIIFDYDDPESAYCAPSRKSQLANMMMLNKTDSLTSLFMAIVAAEPLILAPSWDEFGEYLLDFTNNHRVMTEASREKGGRRFVYHRHGAKPDDFLHAVNFGFQLIKLHYNQALIVDPAGREMIRSAVGGDGGSVQSGWAAALSSYSRNNNEFD